MSGRPPWSLLGIGPTADTSAIRKAYAEKLKAMDVDADVSGFAQLRQARDLALRLARSLEEIAPDGDAQPAGGDDSDGIEDAATDAPEAAAAPARWTFAAPELPGAWQEDPFFPASSLATRPAEPDASTMLERMAWAAAAAREAGHGGVSGAGIPLTTIDPFTAPLLSGSLVGDDALGLRPGETPAERLSILLDPEREDAGEPLSESEARQATRALRAILDEATHAHITRQQQIEDWLAEILARGWPRSAPLLEDANQAFGWEREWSAHDARPAVQFLGARLRGYRFQQNVLQPGHKFHKAWNELVRPGKAGPLRMLGGPAQGVDVALLRGVRKHFPELESHFAPERVASWEGGNPMLTGLLVLLGIIAFAIIVAIADSKSPSPSASPAQQSTPLGAANETQDGPARDVMQSSVKAAFGPGHDPAWLWKTQPELAQTFTANVMSGLRADEDPATIVDKTVAIVRLRGYLNGRELDGPLFEQTMHLRLAQLRAAQKDGESTCQQLGDSGWFDGALPLSASEREAERVFSARMAEENKLIQPSKSRQRTAMVPGELIGRVIKATGLTQTKVAAAMQGRGTNANRCAVAIALLDATLEWKEMNKKGGDRRAILQTL